jgi:hypothetical protein
MTPLKIPKPENLDNPLQDIVLYSNSYEHVCCINCCTEKFYKYSVNPLAFYFDQDDFRRSANRYHVLKRRVTVITIALE